MAAEHTALIGRRIAEAREDADLTQAELAAKIPGKADGTQISKWERGIHRPGDDTLARIAEATGKPLAWFHTKPAEKANGTPALMDALDPEPADVVARLDSLEQGLARLEDQMGQLVGLLTGDPSKTAIISDALVKALERAMGQRAREAGRPARRPPRRPLGEDERPAA